MKQFLLLLGVVCVSLPAMGQTLTLSANTDVYERPDQASAVKLTLPAGIELSILSEQGDWLAISTTTGVVGWIQRPGEQADKSDDLDDLLKSIDEASKEAAPADAPAPPPSPTPAPAPAGISPPAAPDAAMPAPSTSTPPPPPPPSARPPSMDGDVSFGSPPPSDAPFTNLAAGFYDKYQWITAALDLKNDYKRLDLQFNKILGSITQLGGWLSGIDGFPIVDLSQDNLGDLGGIFSKGETTESCACGENVKTFQGGLRFNVYPMSPTVDRPYGFYLGGFAGGGAFTGDDAPEGVSMATAGGEIGIFAKFGSPHSPQFIPSAAVQMGRTEFICGSDTDFCGFDPDTGDTKDHIGDTGTTARFGLEMNYHGLVPGVHLTLIESPDPEKSFETLFGFGFTLAY